MQRVHMRITPGTNAQPAALAHATLLVARRFVAAVFAKTLWSQSDHRSALNPEVQQNRQQKHKHEARTHHESARHASLLKNKPTKKARSSNHGHL
jgi:hypothetical protein